MLGRGILADPKSFFGRLELGGDGGRTRQQTYLEKHLSAANSIKTVTVGSCMFIVNISTILYSLGHGLHTLTAVYRSTPPSPSVGW